MRHDQPSDRWASRLLLVALVPVLVAQTACRTARVADVAEPLTEGQVLHIAMTMDIGEIITSEPAVERATNPAVQQFAREMIAAHTEAAQLTRSVAEREHGALLPNQVSVAMENEARGVARELRGARESEFDRMYVEAQHTLHQHGLNTLDFNLIPAARDAEVRAHLVEKRAIVKQHLDRARQILASML